MRAYKVLMVILVVALLVGMSVGCGKKTGPDIGKGTEEEIAEVPEGEGMPPGEAGEGPPMPGGEEGPPMPMMEETGPMGGGDLVQEALAAKRDGRLEQAVVKFEAALLEEPDNEDAHWGLAWTLADQKKNAEAVAEFEKVLELTEDPMRRSDAEAAIERLQ